MTTQLPFSSRLISVFPTETSICYKLFGENKHLSSCSQHRGDTKEHRRGFHSFCQHLYRSIPLSSACHKTHEKFIQARKRVTSVTWQTGSHFSTKGEQDVVVLPARQAATSLPMRLKRYPTNPVGLEGFPHQAGHYIGKGSPFLKIYPIFLNIFFQRFGHTGASEHNTWKMTEEREAHNLDSLYLSVTYLCSFHVREERMKNVAKQAILVSDNSCHCRHLHGKYLTTLYRMPFKSITIRFSCAFLLIEGGI